MTLERLDKCRRDIADEMIRRVDTATILRPDEVDDIYRRAQTGEFDTIFDDEPLEEKK